MLGLEYNRRTQADFFDIATTVTTCVWLVHALRHKESEAAINRAYIGRVLPRLVLLSMRIRRSGLGNIDAQYNRL
jgi:hypothetical protein